MRIRALRSIVAIPVGWAVTVGGYVATMFVVALFNLETFQSGVQLSVGWLLVTLSVGLVCSTMGGFVTGLIAQRREIAHAVGLVLFTLSLSLYFLSRQEETPQMPTWYVIAGHASGIAATLFGGWLRMRQRVLLERRSVPMLRAMDNVRFLAATGVSFVAFLSVLLGGTILGVACLSWVGRRFWGQAHVTPVTPMFIVSLILASILARRLFRRILGVQASLLRDGLANDGTRDPDESWRRNHESDQ